METRLTTTISSSMLIDYIKQLYTLAGEWNHTLSIKEKNHLVANYCRRAVYNDFKWVITGGPIDYRFTSFVKEKSPILDVTFGGYVKVTDKSGAVIDANHLFATITGHLSTAGIIKPAWSGWAGDLAQAMEHILELSNNSQVFSELIAYSEVLLFTDAGKFSKEDLNADVDAEYIAELCNSGKSISSAVETYYTVNASSRYSAFINRHGGNDYNFDNYVFSLMLHDDSLYIALGFLPTMDQRYAVTGTFINKLRKLL